MGRIVYDFKRLLTRHRLGAGTLDWFLGRAALCVAIVGLGLGLAATQLVPLYQLGLRSLRPTLATYDYATTFAVAPPQLLTLIFPAMFNFDAERHWALWAPHESTLYVGIAPLLLSLVAILYVRGRAVTFFSLLALISLLLAFGDYLPIKPYAVVWSLPGFSYLRAPARFSLLLSLALAVLAALGTTWLARRARYRGPSRPLVALLNGMLVVPLVLGLGLGAVRWWLRSDPVRSTELFALLLQTSKENWQLGPWHVYYGLLNMTRPDNARTALALALLVVVPILLRLWLVRPRLEFVWGALLVLLTAGDLGYFATSFYFKEYADVLTPATPAVATMADDTGPFRAFVEPALNQRYGANQLAGAGIETVNGYSSLEPPRFADYWWSIVAQDDFLLDLFDVRYVLSARQVPGSRTYDGVTYHPSDRLFSGTAANPSGQAAFRLPGHAATAVVLVAAVEGLGEVPTGTPVAEITLVAADGSRLPVPVRAGIELAEYKAAEPGWPLADYVGPRVVWAGPAFEPLLPATQAPDPVRLYGATIPLAQPIEAAAVEVRTITSTGRLHVFGLGIHADDMESYSVHSADNAKYQPLVEDATSILLENAAARPRISLVGGVIASTELTTADRLHDIAWDPQQQAVVDGLPPEEVRSGTGEAVGEARLLEYTPLQIVVQADLSAPGYLVLADRFDDGWKATVDDAAVPIARANGIERLVALPAGSHVVRFSYSSFPITLGLGISVIAGAAWLGLLVVALGRGLGVGRLVARLPGRRRR
jgi:hypothetical protein